MLGWKFRQNSLSPLPPPLPPPPPPPPLPPLPPGAPDESPLPRVDGGEVPAFQNKLNLMRKRRMK